MSEPSFLTFRVRRMALAVEATRVQSILWLPELTPLAEQPRSIAGVFRLHGAIVPVMDLNVRFGHAARPHAAADRLILLSIPEYGFRGRRCGALLLGVIVDDVRDLVEIPAEAIEPPPFPGREVEPHPFFVRGAADIDGEILMVIDPARLVDFEFPPEEAEPSGGDVAAGPFGPDPLPEAREVFRRRALVLREVPVGPEASPSVALVRVVLGGEERCVEMRHVHSFSTLRRFIPVPCCPETIVGCMNLRGRLLALVDLGPLLNLTPANPGAATQVVVIEVDETRAGLVVDEVLEIVEVASTRIAARTPVAGTDGGEGWDLGGVRLGERMVSVLDLERIVRSGRLVVDDEP